MQIPDEAVRAVCDAIDVDEPDARAALEAAAPAMTGDLLRPLLERHPRIDGEWGPYCGTCWVRGNSRAAWPCAEILAIAEHLPDSSDPPGPQEGKTDG